MTREIDLGRKSHIEYKEEKRKRMKEIERLTERFTSAVESLMVIIYESFQI